MAVTDEELERDGWEVRHERRGGWYFTKLRHPLVGVQSFSAVSDEEVRAMVQSWPEVQRVASAASAVRPSSWPLVGGMRKLASAWSMRGLDGASLLDDLAVTLFGQGVIEKAELEWLAGAGPATMAHRTEPLAASWEGEDAASSGARMVLMTAASDIGVRGWLVPAHVIPTVDFELDVGAVAEVLRTLAARDAPQVEWTVEVHRSLRAGLRFEYFHEGLLWAAQQEDRSNEPGLFERFQAAPERFIYRLGRWIE